jgi:hypothetical protein
MKHVKKYQELFEAQTQLTQEQIKWLDKCTKGRGTWAHNPETGLVDVDCTFNCSKQNLTDFKGVKFGRVKGDFWCQENQLTSLEGAPRNVGRGFFCNDNQLTSLEGAPQRIGKAFDCTDNQLTSLLNGPQEVGDHFNCSDNYITSLVGAPQKVWLDFYCGNNRLSSLEGAPQQVGGSFWCEENQLTTLEGAPYRVGGNFNCEHNQLITLDEAPRRIDGGLRCKGNQVSEPTLKALYKRMKSGMSLEEAVEMRWDDMGEDDRALLAQYNPRLSPEEIRGYQALARLKKRVI